MGNRTGIGWTNHTWNPWYGCAQVSPGCAHCYMFRDMRRYGRNPETVQRSKTKFEEPLGWKEPALVFTCSWSDWFHAAADDWRPAAWDIIRRTPHLTYQILTKRPERILANLPDDWGAGWPNVWLGVSVENQRWTSRIPLLLLAPAAMRFLSMEPLLGPVDISKYLEPLWLSKHGAVPIECKHGYDSCPECDADGPSVDWVIAGGESGPEHRPCELDWLRSLRDQCVERGVPYFLKQLGGWPDQRAHEKAILDGRTWTEMPVHRRRAA